MKHKLEQTRAIALEKVCVLSMHKALKSINLIHEHSLEFSLKKKLLPKLLSAQQTSWWQTIQIRFLLYSISTDVCTFEQKHASVYVYVGMK